MSESLKSRRVADMTARMRSAGIREEDLREKFVFSSGDIDSFFRTEVSSRHTKKRSVPVRDAEVLYQIAYM